MKNVSILLSIVSLLVPFSLSASIEDQLRQKIIDLEATIKQKDEVISNLVTKLKVGDVALRYLEKEGWNPVFVGPTRMVKLNEYDFSETEVILIGNVGILKETKVYKEGIMGSFMMLNQGVSLGKEELYSLKVIDGFGDIQELDEIH